jgi:hypothetical protein
LIVEGPDNVGKTTFLKAVQHYLWRRLEVPCVYQHFGLLPPTWDYQSHYRPYIQPFTLMDRFIMSELAYGVVLRGGCKISPRSYRVLDALLDVCGSVTVVITGSREFVTAQYKQHGDDHFKLNGILAVSEFYTALMVNGGKFKTGRDTYTPRYDFHYHVDDVEGTINWPAENEQLVTSVAHEWYERLRTCNVL